jgi:hypothetical protein
VQRPRRRQSIRPPTVGTASIDAAACRLAIAYSAGSNGGCSSAGRASGCDPECRGFESRHSPQQVRGCFRPLAFCIGHKLKHAMSRTGPAGRPTMTRFARRLVAGVVAVGLVPIAAVTIAAPGVSSAQCDPNWSRNVWTNECKPQPPPPEWYIPKPAYAPSFAPADIPPPPPPPPWAQQLRPVWDGGHQQWVWIGI